MKLPMYCKTEDKNLACKLNKSLYGLGQASHYWFCKFSTSLLNHGFTQSRNEYLLFSLGCSSSLVVPGDFLASIAKSAKGISLSHCKLIGCKQ
ncbi:hypothetical protein CR513_23329, partial [Mucuna pruriens]